ncbi:MAG: hypothetical protein NTU41_12735 [Chloroflexi bacterium]|nr:hypothetical protein [Chloroflexota bacterium]
MWKYYALKIAGFTLARLPRRLSYLIVGFIADVVCLLSPGLRATVADNMRHVLGPEVDDASLKWVVRRVFRNAGWNYLDLVRIPHMKLSDIESRMTVDGWHNIEDALSKGKGIIIVTAHLGSFDMAAQILAVRGLKTTIPVEPLEPPSLLDHFTALRSSKGLTFLPARSGVLQEMLRALRRGEAVLFACDRDVANDGFPSRFFGEETTLPADAVRIAMRTGAPIVPGFSIRLAGGRYRPSFEPALDIIPGRNGAVAANVEKLTQVMEKYIRNYADQWVVLTPIWPRRGTSPSA